MVSTFVLVFVLLMVVVGEVCPKNRIFMRSVYIKRPPEEVFKLIIDKEHYDWRSNIKRIYIVNSDGYSVGSKYKELTIHGYSFTFEIEKYFENEKYEIVTKNFGVKAYWKANLKKYERGTKLFITKETYIENPVVRLFYYLFSNFRSAIDNYVNDILKQLNSKNITSQV